MDVPLSQKESLSRKHSLRCYKDVAPSRSHHVYYDEYPQYYQFSSSLYPQQSLELFDTRHFLTTDTLNPSNMPPALISAPGQFTEGNIADLASYNNYMNQEYHHHDACDHITGATFDEILAQLQQHGQIEEPCPETLEPRMMLRHQRPSIYANTNSQSDCPDPYNNDCGYDFGTLNDHSSVDAVDVYQEVCPLPGSPSFSESTLGSSLCKQTGEDEEVTDKPYARLIYEALLQAPGHRMMLRDIYDWFLENTTKPRESGSNGWQNSIRHNLSMNQAFENDKSTASVDKGQSRKANSVWILTEYAVKHGVQSTTRYRKPGPVRKGANTRVHAVQRQRSGARGGRAAGRSVARSRKQEELSKFAGVCLSTNETSPGQQGIVDFHEYAFDQSPQYEHRPATPATDSSFQPLYTLPLVSDAFDHDQFFKSEQHESIEDNTQLDQYFFEQSASPIYDVVSEIGMD